MKYENLQKGFEQFKYAVATDESQNILHLNGNKCPVFKFHIHDKENSVITW